MRWGPLRKPHVDEVGNAPTHREFTTYGGYLESIVAQDVSFGECGLKFSFGTKAGCSVLCPKRSLLSFHHAPRKAAVATSHLPRYEQVRTDTVSTRDSTDKSR